MCGSISRLHPIILIYVSTFMYISHCLADYRFISLEVMYYIHFSSFLLFYKFFKLFFIFFISLWILELFHHGYVSLSIPSSSIVWKILC